MNGGIADGGVAESTKAAFREWLENKEVTEKSEDISANVILACTNDKNAVTGKILKLKQYLRKKSVWIFGGDGWAYDIGYGGLDHVLASGENVNVLVLDTEVYSNTGGQASKSTPVGSFA
jgi:pyruvate-ferredoxin/flavodoxin oxidoreductase